ALAELLELGMQRHRRLHGGLTVKLGRKADLEQYVLHHVGSVGPLKLERLAAETDVIEAPGLGGQRRGAAHLAGLCDECEAHRAAGRIASRPALARARVRRVAVSAE